MNSLQRLVLTGISSVLISCSTGKITSEHRHDTINHQIEFNETYAYELAEMGMDRSAGIHQEEALKLRKHYHKDGSSESFIKGILDAIFFSD